MFTYVVLLLTLPEDRWISAFRDLDANQISDLSYELHRNLTNKIFGAALSEALLSGAKLVGGFFLLYSALTQTTFGLIIYLAWNLIFLILHGIGIVSFLFIAGEQINHNELMDFCKYSIPFFATILPIAVVEEIVVYAHLRQLWRKKQEGSVQNGKNDEKTA